MTRRAIVIGDIHGCLEEFDELLRVVEYRPGQDRLVLCGDLLDRGPDSVGVVRRAMELQAECVLGNHEEAHLRFRMHETRKETRPGYKNPMKDRPVGTPHYRVYASLGEAEWTWLKTLPNYIHLDDKWTVVHAGCMPGVAIEQQEEKHLTRLRTIDRVTGKMVSLEKESATSERVHWSVLWTGPRSIVYGHNVTIEGVVMTFGGAQPLAALLDPNIAQTLGIDTGCAYGGSLTAAIFDRGRITFGSVQAKTAYAKIYNEKEEA